MISMHNRKKMPATEPSSSIVVVMLFSADFTRLSFILLAKLCHSLLIANLVHVVLPLF